MSKLICPTCGSEPLQAGDGARVFVCSRKGCPYAVKNMTWGKW